MPRSASVRQADITKAIRGATAAGKNVASAEIDPETGRIILVFGGGERVPTAPADDLDTELADFEARHGEG